MLNVVIRSGGERDMVEKCDAVQMSPSNLSPRQLQWFHKCWASLLVDIKTIKYQRYIVCQDNQIIVIKT